MTSSHTISMHLGHLVFATRAEVRYGVAGGRDKHVFHQHNGLAATTTPKPSRPAPMKASVVLNGGGCSG